ncbi:MAG: hypothetical protein COB49_00615 [Alphaproteobacteria bacterium]|nr:MAG: hypothetical protein COB49_00615 [Alphaproteobacteria bacterium]
MKNRIKELRNKQGLSQQQLADLLNCGKSTVVKLERGERRLSDVWAERMAKIFNCRLVEIFEEILPTREIPVISWVQAGAFTEETLLSDLSDAEKIISNYNKTTTFALKVVGSSMNRVAPEGSIIIVNYDDQELIDGKSYIIRNSEGASFKRYRSNPIRFEPQSTDDHDTIFPHDGLHIVGRVVQVLTDL